MTKLPAKIILCTLLFLAGGCGTDNNPNYELRSGNSRFYTLNNSEATERFSTLMYNRTNPANPIERFKMVHISDPHLSDWSIGNNYKSPNNLLESVTFANQQELKINAMVETGDHISNAVKPTAVAFLNSFFRFLYLNNSVPTFSCFGNHDGNMSVEHPNASIVSSELASIFNEYGNYPIQRTQENNCYYYADVPNPQGGVIRFIALYMLDQPDKEYDILHWAVFSQEQINWLGNVALKENMTSQHSVIVLTHFPLQESVWGSGRSIADEPFASYLNNGDFVYSWRIVPEIIEAFRRRSALYKSYPNKFHPQQSITATFNFTGSAGEFVCYLGGHAHCFALFDVANTQSALPAQKMILCTNQAPSETNTFYNKVVRQENSLTSNSFNIYAVDTKEKKVYITFFGAYLPTDNDSFPSILEFSYR
ncbi:MAG: metallophosphoesterase [Bacteroidales bacterium]